MLDGTMLFVSDLWVRQYALCLHAQFTSCVDQVHITRMGRDLHPYIAQLEL